jgi:glutaconate CoA-transferase subunit B
MEPDEHTKELAVTALYSGVTREMVEAQCGWPLRFAADVGETEAPSPDELGVLRALHERTAAAHGSDA